MQKILVNSGGVAGYTPAYTSCKIQKPFPLVVGIQKQIYLRYSETWETHF